MRQILSWAGTAAHLCAFGAVLGIFHILQITARLFGYLPHKITVDYLNFCLVQTLRLTGARVDIECSVKLPSNRPLIVVSNHQSMYDIPLLGWIFRRHHPKYIAKVELGRRLPSVSYNLRHGGSVLIDRSNSRQALPAIGKFGEYIEKNSYCACIFPEGTRAKDGVMKTFKPAGFVKLLKSIPSALIVPVAITGSWELMKNRLKPIPFGLHLKCKVLEPLEPNGGDPRDILKELEGMIRKEICGSSDAPSMLAVEA